LALSIVLGRYFASNYSLSKSRKPTLTFLLPSLCSLFNQAGPLVIHPIFYFFGLHIYGGLAKLGGETLVPFEHSDMQK